MEEIGLGRRSGARPKRPNSTIDMEGVRMERALKAIKSRGGSISWINRLINEIKPLMLDYSALERVIKKKVDLDNVYKTFVSTHLDIIECLDDENEREDARAVYENQMKTKLEIDEYVKTWVQRASLEKEPHVLETNSNAGSCGSIISSRASSYKSVRQKELKAKQAIAELKARQLKVSQEIQKREFELQQKRQSLEIQNELEQTAIEANIWKEDSESDDQLSLEFTTKTEEVIKTEEYVPEESKLPTPKIEQHTEQRFSRFQPTFPDRNGSEFRQLLNHQQQMMEHQQNMIEQQQLSSERIANTIRQGFALPKAELITFNGDPLDYWTFIRSFDNNIARNTTIESEKLTFLLQYCTGKAREVVKSCVTLDPCVGYKEARRLLSVRFGDPYTIAMAHVKRITDGPPLKSTDRATLQDFSDKMKSCENTLKAIGYSDEINSTDNLRRIVERLPFHLKGKWLATSRKIRMSGSRPRISHLSEFIYECAVEANDPVFGSIMDSPTIRDKREKDKTTRRSTNYIAPRGTTLATHVYPQEKRQYTCTKKGNDCPVCDESHDLSNCHEFKRMSYEDRIKVLQRNWICYNCFHRGHFAIGCAEPSACTIGNCRRKHQSLIHRTQSSDNQYKDDVSKQNKQQQSQCHVIGVGDSGHTSNNDKRIFLKIVPVKVQGNQGQSVETYALLDSGSNVSLCDEDLMKELQLDGNEKEFLLTTQEKKNSPRIGTEVTMTVEAMDGSSRIKIPRVWALDALHISENSVPTEKDAHKWPHLKDINLPMPPDKKVKLLIGCNAPDAFYVLEERRGKQGEPYGVKTTLGWTMFGPSDKVKDYEKFEVNFTRVTDREEQIESSEENSLSKQLENFWKSDFGDKLSSCRPTMSIQDKKALTTMEKSATKVNGHYQIALPWKQYPPNLPKNKILAERRLQSLKKKLMSDKEIFKKYCITINDYIDKGYAVKVPEAELDVEDRPVWYLPHHGVFHPQKPEKLRIVFDCAAKHHGTSLNDQLYQGPDLTNTLLGVLTRFRQDPVVVVADIEAMFHQVLVDPKDRDALRFLWWPEDDLSKAPIEYRMRVHLFGATSSPSCSNFSLRKTAEDCRGDFDEKVIAAVLRNFYVDDCLKSVCSVEEAKSFVKEITDLLARGGFRLTKWLCNKREVLQDIPVKERAKSVLAVDLDLDRLPIERALGVQWDVETDKFCFKISLKEKPETRRGILSAVSSIYDPLGFIAPVILPAKIILQDLTRKKLSWDEQINTEDATKWREWLTDVPSLTDVLVERCIKPEEFGDLQFVQLHNFADASEIGYGAVSYARMVNTTDEIHTVFLLGKSRLAPIKTVTIPRLELSAAVLAVKMDKTLREELDIPIHESMFWTDSTTVLQYITNENRRFQTFVANRIAVIHDGSEPSQWHYVPTDLNPADDASRGLSVSNMTKKENRWLNGPEFLQNKEDTWPGTPLNCLDVSDENLEVKREDQVFLVTNRTQDTGVDKIINYFSCWYKLKKAVAWFTRYKLYITIKSKGPSNEITTTLRSSHRYLTVKELQNAENKIIKHVQQQEFPEIISTLKQTVEENKSSKPQRSSLRKSNGSMYKLRPILDNQGILRVGGRLENAPISFNAKHPCILPYSHHITNLIVNQYHKITGHAGQNSVLSSLRQKYWIVKARSAVRKVIRNCFECRKRNANQGEQLMADLPKDRLTPDKPPFTYVGIDYFGPLYVRQARSQVKRYGCLFTCLSIRAVHIEIAHSLDTSSFINALRRFISRRGTPEEIRSDNGTNFVGAERELREAIQNLDQYKINDVLCQKNIEWKFNPPSASHMGGVWERQIRTIRKVLKSLLKEQFISDESLITLMAEVESIINGRPLTPLSNDLNDLEPLTPNHLLLLRSKPQNLPLGLFHKEDLYGRKWWKQVQYLTNVFWKRWTREYLPILQERTKWLTMKRNFTVGDLVLIAEDNVPRGQWQLARVIKVHPDAKGLIRSVQVKTKSATLTRPITKLCLLEEAQVET